MQRNKEKAKNKDEDKEEKEKAKHDQEIIRKAKKVVLDWKLDFNDKKLQQLYISRYNPILVTYLR